MMQFAEKRHGRSPVESLTREHAKNVMKRLTERAKSRLPAFFGLTGRRNELAIVVSHSSSPMMDGLR